MPILEHTIFEETELAFLPSRALMERTVLSKSKGISIARENLFTILAGHQPLQVRWTNYLQARLILNLFRIQSTTLYVSAENRPLNLLQYILF